MPLRLLSLEEDFPGRRTLSNRAKTGPYPLEAIEILQLK
jgi:hypothetical protein